MPQLPCRVEGAVVEGLQLARSTGFPTANLSLLAFPNIEHGVYAAWTKIGTSDVCIPSVVFFGITYSIRHASERFEVHLLDGNRELYGSSLAVELVHFIRHNKHFSKAEDLQMAIEKDVADAKLFFTRVCV